MFVCYWVCNELFSIPLIPSESKLIGTPLFIVVTSNSEILILLLLYYSQSFGYILIKEVKNECINMSGFMKVQEEATERSFELVCSHACVFFSFNDTYSEELKLLPQLV